jgi:hypothetical protein
MTRLLTLFRRFGRWCSQRVCPVLHGGHELYAGHRRDRLFQFCLLCGYETRGWSLETKPRFRRHLAGRQRPPIASTNVAYWPRRVGGRG